jgi:hypothetical protein
MKNRKRRTKGKWKNMTKKRRKTMKAPKAEKGTTKKACHQRNHPTTRMCKRHT